MNKIFLLIISLLTYINIYSSRACACKSPIYPDVLSANFIDSFENIAVLKIKKLDRNDKGGLKSIHVDVLKIVKGKIPIMKNLKISIDNSATQRAICPLEFETNTNYLLFFNGNENSSYIALNALNPYRKLGSGIKDSYISDVEKHLKQIK